MQEIPLGKTGLVALVDDADLDFLLDGPAWGAYRPGNGPNVYARRVLRVGDRRVFQQMHNVLLPETRLVDHANGDGLDNRRTNLRPATQQENLRNRRLPRHSTSGFKGVSRRGDRWRAYIVTDGRQRHLGMFADPTDAARAYDRAAARLFGEFARFNFPPSKEAAA